MVFLAFAMLSLLAIASLTIDLGNWYLHVQQEQRAADSAALAGAVHLPVDPASGIVDSTQVLGINGFSSTAPDASFNVHPVTGKPNEMFVSVTQKVHNIILSALGIPSTTFTREAIAVYRGPMTFGSPDNVLGAEPPAPDNVGGPASWENPAFAGTQSNYWLQIAGGGSQKVDGAEWSAGSCANGEHDLCDPTQPVPVSNLEYSSSGDAIVLSVPKAVSGSMAVDLYDPAYVDSSSQCQLGWQSLLPQTLVPNIYANNVGVSGTPANPYRATPYCTGDRSEGWPPSVPFPTTYTLDYPTSAGGGPVPGCSRTYPGYEPSRGAYNSSWLNPSPSPTAFVNVFHKWSRLCDLNVGAGNPTGAYILRVVTPRTAVGTNDYGVRIAIMAGTNIDWPATDQLQLQGYNSRLEITSVSTGPIARYYVGEITPSAEGGIVKLRFFDIGDQAETLTILPPTGATVNGAPLTSFTGCADYGYDGTPSAEISPASMPSISNCSLHMRAQQFNGDILEIAMPVPYGYSCGTLGLPTDCWFRVQSDYGTDPQVDDYLAVSGNMQQSLVAIVQ